jgi:predicted nuclease of restriction endonuclease-like (RecB) superfamily
MAKKTSSSAKKNVMSATNYTKFITSLKEKIRSAQIKGAVAVNRELIKLYWEIGKEIVEKQEREDWGSKVLERVAKDLQNAFPGYRRFLKEKYV